MNFVLSHPIVDEALKLLEGCSVKVLNAKEIDEHADAIADADAIIARIARVSAKAIEEAPNLKVIGRTGVGFDMVDVQAATARGIPVVLTPGANNHSVAEQKLS